MSNVGLLRTAPRLSTSKGQITQHTQARAHAHTHTDWTGTGRLATHTHTPTPTHTHTLGAGHAPISLQARWAAAALDLLSFVRRRPGFRRGSRAFVGERVSSLVGLKCLLIVIR